MRALTAAEGTAILAAHEAAKPQRAVDMPDHAIQSGRPPPDAAGETANRGRRMSYPVVLARACRGEPWRCLLIDSTERGGFLIGPESLSAFQTGECQPVGFPIEDVFEFDGSLYDRLLEQWNRERRTDDELWRSARRYETRRAA